MKKTIDFVKYGKRLGIISACVLIVGLLFSVIFPVDLDISFKGGTQVKFSYVGDINKTELKQQVEEQLGEKVEMKDATTYDGEKQLNTATFYLTKNLDSEKTDKMEKAVITVIGKDMVGILAKVSNMCAEKDVNVLEVTQSILHDMFVMVMLVDITHATVKVADLADTFDALGESLNLKIHVMHEDIFNSMHRI